MDLEKELSSIDGGSSRSLGEVKKDRTIEYSYKHGQAMNDREARKTYDYQEIKNASGYTRKRTITGVRTFK